MKRRGLLTGKELEELRQGLVSRLEGLGVESQPEVAIRVLELSKNPKAQLKDYAGIVRTDPALSGKLLKLANSAYFAQRVAVTSLERACLLLGVDRLRAISLGFHLSRASAADKSSNISREVWGQSVLRACLAGELAKVQAPTLISEAFVIGLMMDAGLPLMKRLVGQEFMAIYEGRHGPGKLARLEFDTLAMSHVDVIAAMARCWRLPELLAYPLEWHHTAPSDVNRDEPVHRLHRIAYCVGLLDLTAAATGGGAGASGGSAGEAAPRITAQTPGLQTLQRVLRVEAAELKGLLERTAKEYSSALEMFSEISDAVTINDDLLERMHLGLTSAVERMVMEGLEHQSLPEPTAHVILSGQRVEIERTHNGRVNAYLYDGRGQRLVTHTFDAGKENAVSLSEVLGVELTCNEDEKSLDGLLQKYAA